MTKAVSNREICFIKASNFTPPGVNSPPPPNTIKVNKGIA